MATVCRCLEGYIDYVYIGTVDTVDGSRVGVGRYVNYGGTIVQNQRVQVMVLVACDAVSRYSTLPAISGTSRDCLCRPACTDGGRRRNFGVQRSRCAGNVVS